MAKEDFKVIIAGTRDFADYELLKEKCDAILSSKKMDYNIVIVSGTARGADRLGERYARERGYRIDRHPADWDRDGNSAGPIRNALMADNAHALIAFWDGRSRGTMNMIRTAKAKGLMVRIVDYQRTNVKQPTIQHLNLFEAQHPKLKVPKTPLTEVLAQARKLFGDEIFVPPVEVDLGRGKEKISTIYHNPRDGGYYKGGTMNEITTNIVEKDIEVLTRSVRDAIVNRLKRLPGAYLTQLDEELKRVVNNSGLRSEENSNVYTINDEGEYIDPSEARDAAINQKLGQLRQMLGSDDFTLTDADNSAEAVIDFEVGRYYDGTYSLSPVLSKSGKQAPKEYDYDGLLRELNNKLNAVRPKKYTADFLLKHSVKAIEVDVQRNDTDPSQNKVSGVRIKDLLSSSDHVLMLAGAKIIDANIDWGDGVLETGKENPAEYLIGDDLHEQLGKELADKILSMKESGTIPYPAVSDDAALLNDFYAEKAYMYVDQAKEAIISRTTSPSARQFETEQQKSILPAGMRLSLEERTALFDDLWQGAESKLASARIPDAWKQSAHDELLDLAKNGPEQHQSNGLRR